MLTLASVPRRCVPAAAHLDLNALSLRRRLLPDAGAYRDVTVALGILTSLVSLDCTVHSVV